jgi:sodium/proton antiporter, NhaA family (TC 2.A.33.1.1)
LHRFINYVVLPLFALANAGIVFFNFGSSNHQTVQFTLLSVALAVSLVFGKIIGISLFSWLAVRMGFAQKPKGASWLAVIGVACLGGIGFTMSLFIASLAFPSAAILAEAKLGIFAGSLVAGIVGYLFLKRTLKARP